MKLLSLDQATKITGYAIKDGNTVHYSTLSVDPKLEPLERMKHMFDKIKALIEQEKPDYVSIEDTQMQGSPKVYQQLSQFQGALFGYFFDHDTPFVVIPPVVWKSHCGLKGRKREEQKANTIAWVKETYGFEVNEDEADALGQMSYFSSILQIDEDF